MSIYEIVTDFFRYFGSADFEYEKHVISVRLGGTKVPRDSPFLEQHSFMPPKSVKGETAEELGQQILYIEEPMKRGSPILCTPPILLGYFREFQKAYWRLEHGQWDELMVSVLDAPTTAFDVWEQYRQFRRYKAWRENVEGPEVDDDERARQRTSDNKQAAAGHEQGVGCDNA
ncbi:hypothetical protein EV182_005610 [Spiromyces aspiralis]|uniref:Uncharacterized protein n=1 Tax=Spiromyces aspiralis TaxID=68401 RepID=A0ACC1H9R7_9FUNG|nr:hypothetical protein EV182_005610 [Spiromyces aspiralis]